MRIFSDGASIPCCLLVAACVGERAQPATPVELEPAPNAARDPIEGRVPAQNRASLSDECDSLINPVNVAVAKIERLSSGRADIQAEAISNLRKIGEAWDDLASELRQIEISSRALRDKRRLYVSMARRAAVAAGKVANALESRDAMAGSDGQKELDQIVSEEDELVNQLNDLCQRTE